MVSRGDIPWKVRCGAKRRNGEPCRNWALRGATRCKLHGGATPKAQAKAKERLRAVAALSLQDAVDVIVAELHNPRLQPKTRIGLALAIMSILGFDVAAAREALEVDPMDLD